MAMFAVQMLFCVGILKCLSNALSLKNIQALQDTSKPNPFLFKVVDQLLLGGLKYDGKAVTLFSNHHTKAYGF